MRNIAIEQEQMPCKSSLKALYNYRICLDFTVYCFYVILFRLFESLFGIFTFFDLANRPLFAATKQCKSSQKQLSTKLEIKSKQILNRRKQKTATRQKCNCIGGSRGAIILFMDNLRAICGYLCWKQGVSLSPCCAAYSTSFNISSAWCTIWLAPLELSSSSSRNPQVTPMLSTSALCAVSMSTPESPI